MAERSLTDLQAVRPRGPKIFVALTVLMAAGVASWWFFLRPEGPIGAPDNPTHVLLVSDSQELAQDLQALGFTVRRDSVEALEAQARDESIGPGRSGTDAVLQLADAHGFGYVAFENPATVSFPDMRVSSDSSDISSQRRFAVFSIGDLAFPHHVTVDSNASLYAPPKLVLLLRSLFAQQKLAGALLPPQERSIESGPIAETLDAAVDLVGAYNALDVEARRIARGQAEDLVDEETADPKPAVLAGPLDQSRAVPAGGGGLVLFVERPSLSSAKTGEVSLDPPGGFLASHLPSAATDIEGRQPCDGIDPHRYFRDPSPIVSAGSQALGFDRGAQLEVWVYGGAQKRCAYTKVGRIDVGGLAGELGERGQWLRVSKQPEVLVMEVLHPNGEEPVVIPLLGCTHVGHPSWIGPDFATVGCIHDPQVARMIWPSAQTDAPSNAEPAAEDPPLPAEAWIYYVRLSDGMIVAQPWQKWELTDGGFGLVAMIGEQTLRLLVTDDERFPRWLWSAGATVEAMFASSERGDPTASRPSFVTDSSGVAGSPGPTPTVERIEIDPTARNVRVSPGGRWLAMEVDGGPLVDFGRNVALYDLRTKTTHRVANNRSAEHFAPHFTTDGKHLVFNSRYGSWEEARTAARLVKVP